jgi:hypothetical protein
MGFFSRRNKRDFNVDAVKVPEVTYPDLQTALQSVTNGGAKDTKSVTITWQDGTSAQAVIYGDTLKYLNQGVINSELAQIIESRVSTSRTDIHPGALDALKKALADEETSHIAAVERVDQVSPMLAAFMNMILGELAENHIMRLHDHGPVTEVEADWSVDFTPTFMQRFTGVDIRVEQVNSMAEHGRRDLQRAETITRGEPLGDVLIENTGPQPADPSEEQHLILDLLLDRGGPISLEDLQQHATGYIWSHVLKAAENLMYDGAIDITYPNRQESSLPDLGPLTVAKPATNSSQDDTGTQDEHDSTPTEDGAAPTTGSTPESSQVEDPNQKPTPQGAPQPEETVPPEAPDTVAVSAFDKIITGSDEDDSDGFTFFMPDDNDLTDEGGFDFTDEDETLTTTMAGEDLRPLINQIVRESTNVDQTIIPVLTEEIEYNAELEAGVIDLDNRISEVRQTYQEDFGRYNIMAMDIIGDQAQKGQDVTLEGAGEPIEHAREDANDQFFTLEDLEHRRFNLNATRINLLKSILERITHLDGAHVQECVNLIEMKIQGIQDVTDTAFHSPKDDEAIAKKTDLKLIESVLVPETITPDDSPLFYRLVSTMGFNPFDSTSSQQ